MPQSDRQAPHDRYQCNLFPFRITFRHALIGTPRRFIMTHLYPTGLTKNLAQSGRSLPTDVTFTIVLLATFMARRRQTDEFTDLAAPAEAARISDFGPIDQRRDQAHAGLLHPLIHDRLMARIFSQLTDQFVDFLDLRLDGTELPS
jgi:hypothetical protein